MQAPKSSYSMWLLCIYLVKYLVCNPTWSTAAGFLKIKSLKLFQPYSFISFHLLVNGIRHSNHSGRSVLKSPPLTDKGGICFFLANHLPRPPHPLTTPLSSISLCLQWAFIFKNEIMISERTLRLLNDSHFCSDTVYIPWNRDVWVLISLIVCDNIHSFELTNRQQRICDCHLVILCCVVLCVCGSAEMS